MLKRIRDAKNERWKKNRELLRDYVLVLSNSGIRVGEATTSRSAMSRLSLTIKDDAAIA